MNKPSTELLLKGLAQIIYETFHAEYARCWNDEFYDYIQWKDLDERDHVVWRAVVDSVRDNLRANRWSEFASEELKRLKERLRSCSDRLAQDLFYGAEVELSRRAGLEKANPRKKKA